MMKTDGGQEVKVSKFKLKKRSPRSIDEQMNDVHAEMKRTQEMQETIQSLSADLKNGELGLNLDFENAKLEEVKLHHATLSANIAGLIGDLDTVTAGFGEQFKTMREETLKERVIGWFSKTKSNELRQSRISSANINSQLTDLVNKSNVIINILTQQKDVIQVQYNQFNENLKICEVERIGVLDELKEVRDEIEQIDPQLCDLDEQIAVTTDISERADIELQRTELAKRSNELINQEQVLIAKSQSYEKYTKMYKSYIDSLNNQLATQSVLINKLRIDTEQREYLYDGLVKSLQTASQQEVAHKINTIGEKVDSQAQETLGYIAAASNDQMAKMFEQHGAVVRNIDEITERKRQADEKFNRRMAKIIEEHDSGVYTTEYN